MRAAVRCPSTFEEFEIDLPTSARAVAILWRRTITSSCPHCGDEHLDGFRQLFEQAALTPRAVSPSR